MTTDFSRAIQLLTPLAKSFGAPITVEMQPEQAEEVKQNLIRRSLRFGELQYGFYFQSNGVRIIIRDNP